MAENSDSGRSILQHARETVYGGQVAGSALDVFIQDYTTPPFQYYLMQELKDDITLVSGTHIDDEVVYVSAGHGFTAGGEYIVIREGNSWLQTGVDAVAGDDITIRAPVSYPYTVDGATVIRGRVDMNVSGSYSDQVYQMPMWGDTPVDIQTVRITMQHGGEGDDSMFGDLAALTEGIQLAKVDDEIHQHLGNYRQNQNFREFGAEIDYTDKAGGGNFATNITFDLKNTYGVVLRVDPRINGVFKAIIQDDLNDLLRLRISLMGQFTLGE